MSYSITVEPSGDRFEAEPSETLLQAGLRAGLNLGHNCANGSCGECRARLLSGDIAPFAHFDFHFGELEKRQGWFLLCSCRATSDLVVEAHQLDSAAEIPEQRVRAKVSRIERLQDDIQQLTVRTPRSGGLHFLAGQSVALAFDDMQPKILPIASCPCDSIQLRFHLRRCAGDSFSEFVFDRLRKGSEVRLRGPCGDFTLDEASNRPLVFITWESGFAPVSSLIDHAIRKDVDRSIDLYWLSAIPRGHYLSNYCRAWRDVLDDFRYHSIDLVPAGTEHMDQVVERILRVHTLLADHDYYLALPQDGLDLARVLLNEAGIPDEQIRTSVMSQP